MIKMLRFAVLAFLFMGICTVTAQESFGPTSVGMMEDPVYVPSIAEQMRNNTAVYAESIEPHPARPKLRSGNKVIPGKGFPKGDDPLLGIQANAEQRNVKAPDLIFAADSTPQAGVTDPSGAAGPNHYIAAWNFGFRIFDKSGTPLTPEMALSTLFPGNNIGDPIVFFDANVDNGPGQPRGRFVVTEFDNNPNGFNVAVSEGPDPVNDGWHIYTTGFGTGAFPDYTKFSVWGDAYVVTANVNNGATGDRVFAVERNEMLNGDPAQFIGFPLPGIATNGFYSPQAFHTTADETVPPGTPAPIVYMQDDAWAGVTADHLQIWEATINFDNPASSSIVTAQELFAADGVSPFVSVFDGGSFSNRPQGGGVDIDILQATVMNQVQYRRFGTHNSVVLNFVVDVLAGAPELAAIRWYELRQTADGMPWTVFQEGTYTAPDGRDAYSGSMAMNSLGDIALGYTSSSATDRISIRYTGQINSGTDGPAPSGVMNAVEQLIAQSTAANPDNRLADYVQLTNDPADDSFWHIAEYFNPQDIDIVANFTLEAPEPDDIGVLTIDAPVNGDLTSTEAITVTIRNFGSNDITDPDVQYTIDGGTPVVEQFSGTIAAGTNETYTFSQTADLSGGTSFLICASTLLSGDTDPGNDETCSTVVNSGNLECTSFINDTDMPVGPNAGDVTESVITVGGTPVSVLDVNVTINVDHTWNADLDIELIGPEGDVVSLASGVGGSDDNFTNTTFDDDAAIAIGDGTAPFTGTFQPAGSLADFNGTLSAGDWTLRLTDNANQDGGTLFDWTLELCGDEALNVEDPNAFDESDFTIIERQENIFDISLRTAFDGNAAISVYNIIGQQVVFNNLDKEGDAFNYQLDMSYAATGVYIVQFGDVNGGTTVNRKIVVK